jgi:hypothetical protein
LPILAEVCKMLDSAAFPNRVWNFMIVRFFKIGLFPLTAIVPVFDQGIWSCRKSSVSFGRRRKARSKSRQGPILTANVRGPKNLGDVKSGS